MKSALARIAGVLLAVQGLGAQGGPPPATGTHLYNTIRTNDLARLRADVRTAADANQKDNQGNTPLMEAAAVGSVDAVRLLLDRGADVNAQSGAGLSPLMLAVNELPKVRLLLEHGANVNAVTQTKRSALFIAAMSPQSASIVRLLLSKGADVKAVDVFKNTMLMAATAGNDTDTIRLMVDAGIDVNAATVAGLTPLMAASGMGNITAVKLLLAKGANVNAVGKPFMALGGDPKAGPVVLDAYTPLLMAASAAPVEVIQVLLDAGANVNAVDARKLSALMLATAADHQNAATIKLLLARGADPSLKSAAGETAADWAAKIGAPEAMSLLHAGSLPALAPPENTAPPELRVALSRSVALLEKSSQLFFDGSGCVSCHAQSITDLAVAEARAKRVPVDDKAASDRVSMLKTGGFPADVLYQRLDILIPEILAYQLASLAAIGYPADRTTDAMALNIAIQQRPEGVWRANGVQQRPGGEDGDIFRTALAIRSLAAYGPPGRFAEMKDRIARARGWIVRATPVTAEDRTMQLLGAFWAGADAATTKRLGQALVATQQPDGGWRQREGLASDAYATGESLYALAKAGGIKPSDPVYQNGVAFLLKTQRAEDGSWRVRSRSPKFQVPFQSFPYAGDQWISQWATGWATMALAQAID